MRFSGRRSATIIVLGLSLALGGVAGAADPRSELQLQTVAFDPVTEPDPTPRRLQLGAEPESGYFVVQFDAGIDTDLSRRVRGTGAEMLQYLPDRSYLVRVPVGGKEALRALDSVRWLGAFQPGWKLSPELGVRPFQDPSRREGGKLFATVDLHIGETLVAAAPKVAATGVEMLGTQSFSDTRRFQVRGSTQQLEEIAGIEAVAWIEERAEITSRNNTAHWVVQSDVSGSESVWDRGLHGEGQIVGHIDSRINMNSCHFRDDTNNTPGPGHRKVIAYRSNSGLGSSSHGTHTAGTLAGNQFPVNGTLNHAGHAYEAKISHTNLSDVNGFNNSTSNLYENLEFAHGDGARVHTNSWGDDGLTIYTTWSRDIDLFSYDHEDSLVLFAVTNTSSLRTPENAKNVLAVGGSFNGTSNDSFCTGGAGPTSDGRRKPEIFAPGCSIVSAGTSTCSTSTQTGTSMACPAVTGAGALVRQYFEDGWYPSGAPVAADALVPSGALVKATLLNSAVNMTNYAGSIPNSSEGWGRVLLENALHFDGDTRKLFILSDTRNASGLDTGESIDHLLSVTGSGEPLKISLVFTDPAAAVFASSAAINDLDLVVTSPSGTEYKGNVFSGGLSTTGGSPDAINNVEMVLLDNPELGLWTVTVNGTAVNQGKQGFALIATGEVSSALSGKVLYAAHVVDDSGALGNGNGILDPGETVTVPLTLRNERVVTSTSVSASVTKQNGAPGVVLTGVATYPDMGSNALATSNAPHYRVTVPPDAVCGAAIPLDLRATYTDGEDDSVFALQVGQTLIDVGSGDTPQNIPQKTSIPVTSTIDVTDPVTPVDVNASVQIAHGDIGEMIITLTSPGGSSVTLHDRSSGGTVDIDTVYDADTTPDGPGSMDDFDGAPAQGTWTLTIRDLFGGLTPPGTLQGWTLSLDPGTAPVCNPLTCPGDPVPAAVGPTLELGVENGTDLRFDWQSLPGASGYRLWRSATPDFAVEELVETSTANTLVEADGLAEGLDGFYRVRAVNSCEWEGP